MSAAPPGIRAGVSGSGSEILVEQRGWGGAGLRGSRGAGEAGSAPSARPARAWDGHPAPSPGNTQQRNGPVDGPPPPAEAEHGTRASRRSVLRGPHVAQSPSGFDPVCGSCQAVAHAGRHQTESEKRVEKPSAARLSRAGVRCHTPRGGGGGTRGTAEACGRGPSRAGRRTRWGRHGKQNHPRGTLRGFPVPANVSPRTDVAGEAARSPGCPPPRALRGLLSAPGAALSGGPRAD